MTSDWQRWRAGRTQWGEMPPSSVQMAVVHGGRAVARLSCRGVVCNHYQQLESRGMYYRSGWLRRPGAPDESVASAAAPGASRRGDVLAAIVRRRALRGCGQVLVPGAVSDRDRGQSPSRLIAANGRSPALNTGACGLRMVEDSWRHGRYMHLGAGHSNFPCQQRRDAPCSAPCAICAAWKVHPRRAFLRSSNPPVHARRPLVLGCPCRPTWQSRKVHLERLNPAHNPASRLTPPGDCSALLVRSCPIYNYTISRACWCTRLVSSLAKTIHSLAFTLDLPLTSLSSTVNHCVLCHSLSHTRSSGPLWSSSSSLNQGCALPTHVPQRHSLRASGRIPSASLYRHSAQ
jgi:hypothetical protein